MLIFFTDKAHLLQRWNHISHSISIHPECSLYSLPPISWQFRAFLQGCSSIQMSIYQCFLFCFDLSILYKYLVNVNEVICGISDSGIRLILQKNCQLLFPNELFLAVSPVWEYIKQMLNPETSTGAGPWVYYTIYSFFVFVFNIFDIVSVFDLVIYILWRLLLLVCI